MSSNPSPGRPIRSGFSAELAEFDTEVQGFLTTVTEAVRQATAAFVAGDRVAAEKVTDGIALSPATLAQVEQRLDFAFARQAPMGTDLRLMITTLRVLPILERAVELARHIADRAGFADHFPAEVLRSYSEMGAVATRMWEKTSAAWQQRDSTLAGQMDRDDDELDTLARGLAEHVSRMTDSPIVEMEGRLIVRFFERIGDHAVDVAHRILYLTAGTEPASS